MKNKLFGVAAVLIVGIAAGVVSARAAIPERLYLKVPFDFIVDNTTMPAGEYTFDNPDPAMPDIIAIRSADGYGVFIQTEPVSPKNSRYVEKSKLDFTKINGKEYLTCIWAAGMEEGNAISKAQLLAETR
jgi:hypothetical protein